MTSHCLIVDLDNSHTQALSALTRKAGFDTTVLSDISMVEQWLQSHEPSLAIFDLNLINDRLELFDLPNFDHCEILIMAEDTTLSVCTKQSNAGPVTSFVSLIQKIFSPAWLKIAGQK